MIARNVYGVYDIPKELAHRPVCQTLLSGNVYEPDTIEYVINNCADGDIITAGAFIGDFLPAFDTACKGTVWAYEPIPINFEAAYQTMILNQLERTKLSNIALGNTPDIVNMQYKRKNTYLGGESKVVKESGDNIIEIQQLPLDDIIPKERKISIIQFDLEGYEENALMGASRIIKENSPHIIVETAVDNLKEIGYNLVGRLHNNYLYIRK